MSRHPLVVRIAAMLLVLLAIVVPLALIGSKASERAARAVHVAHTFAQETTGDQSIAGPFLVLTCEQSWDEKRETLQQGGRLVATTERRSDACPSLVLAPRTLQVDADMPVQTLRRGIYPIRAFTARVKVRGEFEWPAPPEQTDIYSRRWKEAYVVTRIGDPRGIRSVKSAQGTDLLARRGVEPIDSFTMREAWGEPKAAGTRTAFSYDLSLAGTGSFQVLPVGDESTIRIASDWPHPSFAPRWSPESRTIDESGFRASWRTTQVATGGSAAWSRQIMGGEMLKQPVQGAGVSLVEPVDIYALSSRATSYGFLFVLFTFAALGIAEVLGGVRMHPIQYTLVGLALAVFFLLLLALAEHIAFGPAYLAASGACVALLTFYLRVPLRTRARTAGFLAIFVAMYGTLFVLLRLEDHALLVGSILVFAVLAATMALTRRVDWGALAFSPAPPSAAPGNGAPTPAS